MSKTCLIIGLGQIGMGYDYKLVNKSVIYTHAYAIEKHPKFNLIGGVDNSEEKKILFEKRFKVPAFDNVEKALKKLQPDLVVIATPTETHNSILSKIINLSKPRIILCEKPLSYKIEDAKNMINKCKEARIDLFVNYIRSVDSGVLEIKRRIVNGKILAPLKVNVWYSKGIFNNGSHFLNLLEMWLGKVESVKLLNNGGMWNNKDPEPDFEIKFNLGTAIFRAAWEEAFSHYSIELLSSTGRLFYDKGGEKIEFQSVSKDINFKEYIKLNDQKELIGNSMDIYQWQVYDNIDKHLNGYETTLCTGFKALETLKQINLIIKERDKS